MAGLINNEKYTFYYQKVGQLYKKPEVKASLEVILSVFTVAILIFAAIRPTLSSITALQKKIADQEIVNKKADNKIAQLISAQKQLETNRDSLYLFDEAVPDVFSYADSAKRIEYLAKQNNLTIESMSFSGVTLESGKKVKGDWVEKISQPTADNILKDQINFSVNGDPSDVINFLKLVENMDRLATLSNVSMTKQLSSAKENDYLKASGKITFYFYLINK